MKVSELEGAELDLWSARALGGDGKIEDWGSVGYVCVSSLGAFEPVMFNPSTAWSDGGPIIERAEIGLWNNLGSHWVAQVDGFEPMSGGTVLIAAMRAFVASKYGDEVPSEPLAELVAQAQELDMGY